ncbi:MAG: nicotinate (nicotinamide) nucleotide adenylyltransferase [Oscillospiraceae bacterium]|nr:nicotinate (nicotinamide) nucleotide adenylyltransferase [Oscillospiraceae bacterium]
MKDKIGIFGGSFDPMHSGHTKLAHYLLSKLELSSLIIMPAAVSPFKSETYSSDEDRLNICRLSLPEEQFVISDFEISRGGVSYSYDTVSFFKELYPEDEILFVIGEDQLLIFNKWRRWKEILQKVTLVAVKRNNCTPISELEDFADKNIRPFGKVIILPFEPFEVSSTQIRERQKNGESIEGLVSPQAQKYIAEKGLYLGIDEQLLLKDVRKRLSDYRYHHSVCVAESAKELAKRFGADEYKAYIAGIAHDILKEQPEEEAKSLFDKAGVSLSELEKRSKKLWHAIAGEAYLREKYSLPEDILSAVRYHTTGKGNMTLLQKILFVADFISADREYDGVRDMRERAKESLETAMEEGLRFTIEELSAKCLPIHPDTLSAYNQILLRKEKEI